MIRIPRAELDMAIQAFMACAEVATDIKGRRIKFPLDARKAEGAILGALGMMHGWNVSAADVYFMDMEDGTQWPPAIKGK